MGRIYAISSKGKTEKSLLDLRFGKCEHVVIFDSGRDEINIYENPFKSGGKSGIRLVEHLQSKGVDTIVTGEVGPGVSALLEKERLQLVLLEEERIKIEDVLSRIKS